MPIVADTTVFRYLVVVEVTDILPALFGHVLIPLAVFNELQRVSTPAVVRTWFVNLPHGYMSNLLSHPQIPR
jgi:predicted nucleic acid-binding protein